MPDQKIAYIHLPRTGGCSIERAMYNVMFPQNTITRMTYEEKITYGMFDMHMPLRAMEQRYDLSDYRVFATIRDENERMQSLIGHVGTHPGEGGVWGSTNWFLKTYEDTPVELIPFEGMAEFYGDLLGVPIPHLNKGGNRNVQLPPDEYNIR